MTLSMELNSNRKRKSNSFENKSRKSPKLEGPTLFDSPSNFAKVIKKIWSSRPGEVVSTINGIQLIGKDFYTLKPKQWLNDQIIDAYMSLIMERSRNNEDYLKVHIFSTHFYPALKKSGYDKVKRWTNKIDIFSCDLLLFPIHADDHWSLVAVDLKHDHIAYFDSIQFMSKEFAVSIAKEHARLISKYLKDESKEKRNCPFKRSNTRASSFNEPVQNNENDCGVFLCQYAENLARGMQFGNFDFQQSDVPRIRKQMCYELGVNRLLKQGSQTCYL